MTGPVLMREYCSISTLPMAQTTDSAKNRKPVAAKGPSKRPSLSEGEVERKGGGGKYFFVARELNKKNPQRPGMA